MLSYKALNAPKFVAISGVGLLCYALLGCTPAPSEPANAAGGSGATSGGTGATGSGGTGTGAAGGTTGAGAAGGAGGTGTSGGAGGSGGGQPGFRAASAVLYQTSKAGDKLTNTGTVTFADTDGTAPTITIDPGAARQKIIGFGGSFTESSAAVLLELPAEKRQEVIDAYFSQDGAHYSLTRTHIASCDFSFGRYSYAAEEDAELNNFSIEEDMDDLIPLIKDAMAADGASFKIMASPWSAPPWMKTNNDYYTKGSVGGKLLAEHRATFALYFSKYISAYKEQGIDIWAVTPENEPLGNSGQWESMEFTPAEMRDFIRDHLGPQLAADGHATEILIFDQNRAEAMEWADVIFGDAEAAQYSDGVALHWYGSTFKVYPEVLDALHEKYPDKILLNSEATIDALRDQELEMSPPGDATVPWGEETGTLHYWQQDTWWWEKNATDWGFFWAPEADKPDHPPYEPVFRYVRDIIVSLNHWFVGWIDWNIVLNKVGGPNHQGNWCAAPVMIDTETDDVYYTPMYYALAHFSKFIRPDATVLSTNVTAEGEFIATSALNPDGTIAVEVANLTQTPIEYRLQIGTRVATVSIPDNAVQTLVVSQ